MKPIRFSFLLSFFPSFLRLFLFDWVLPSSGQQAGKATAFRCRTEAKCRNEGKPPNFGKNAWIAASFYFSCSAMVFRLHSLSPSRNHSLSTHIFPLHQQVAHSQSFPIFWSHAHCALPSCAQVVHWKPISFSRILIFCRTKFSTARQLEKHDQSRIFDHKLRKVSARLFK